MMTNDSMTAKPKQMRLFVTPHEKQQALGIIVMHNFCSLY